jgi:hypothetical protein
MGRDLWRWIVWALCRLPRRRPTGAVYDNREVLAVLLWAALHDRSILWATKRQSWPVQAWRRRLPDQSTMSRRLRDPELERDLERLVAILQRRLGAPGSVAIVDGKPTPVSEFSGDPDAARGWGAGIYARGYKLHALIDEAMRVLAWEVRPMNEAESVVAADLVRKARDAGTLASGTLIVGDASYDSNPLHFAAADAGARLLAPRRRPDQGIGKNQRHHPNRLEAVRFTEHDPAWERVRTRVRTTIERWFGILVTACRLHGLPAWVRRLHRVRLWIGAKIVLDAGLRAGRARLDA